MIFSTLTKSKDIANYATLVSRKLRLLLLCEKFITDSKYLHRCRSGVGSFVPANYLDCEWSKVMDIWRGRTLRGQGTDLLSSTRAHYSWKSSQRHCSSYTRYLLKPLNCLEMWKDLRDERQIGNSVPVPNEPLLLRKDAFEDTEHSENLVLVAVDGALDLLGVVHREPKVLTEVRAIKKSCLTHTKFRRAGGRTLDQMPGRKATG